MTLKQKVRLFAKIQAATFAIGLAFIVRENAEHGSSIAITFERVKEVLLGDSDPTQTRWLFLLPLLGTFLYFLRVDRRPRTMRQVFFKWSILFLILEFTTEWTKVGWGQATSDFPVMLIRYTAGGALAAAVWWLIERSPRTHPDTYYRQHGHGHSHASRGSQAHDAAATTSPGKAGRH